MVEMTGVEPASKQESLMGNHSFFGVRLGEERTPTKLFFSDPSLCHLI